MGLLEVGFGWLLGFGSSFIFRWYDREQKVNEFKRGLYAELQENLPLLVGNVLLMKDILGEIDHEFLKWHRSILSNCPKEAILEEQSQLLDSILNLSPEQLSKVMQLKASLMPEDRAKGLKKFFLRYYENNISSITLFPVEIQGLIFKLHTKLNMINQEIDRYYFYFDKTFDPNSVNVNQDILRHNMRQSYRMIMNIASDTTDLSVKLLNSLKLYPNRFIQKMNNIMGVSA
jgi:hypothetical protein